MKTRTTIIYDPHLDVNITAPADRKAAAEQMDEVKRNAPNFKSECNVAHSYSFNLRGPKLTIADILAQHGHFNQSSAQQGNTETTTPNPVATMERKSN